MLTKPLHDGISASNSSFGRLQRNLADDRVLKMRKKRRTAVALGKENLQARGALDWDEEGSPKPASTTRVSSPHGSKPQTPTLEPQPQPITFASEAPEGADAEDGDYIATNEAAASLVKPMLFAGPSAAGLHSSLARGPCEGPCRVLGFFGMFLFHGFIVCPLHPQLTVIPLANLAHHLKNSRHSFIMHRKLNDDEPVTSTTFHRSKKDALVDFATHVGECSSIASSQSLDDLRGSVEVDGPCLAPEGISTRTGLTPCKSYTSLRYQCPSCLYWLSYNHSKGSAKHLLKVHLKKCCPSQYSKFMEAAKELWTQRLFLSSTKVGEEEQAVVVEEEGSGETKANSHLFKFLILPRGGNQTTWNRFPLAANFLLPLKLWFQIHRGPKTIQLLIAVPTLDLVWDSQSNEPKRRLEKGLLRLKRVLLLYLREALRYIELKPYSFRRVLGHGVSSIHKVASDNSLYKPCAALTSVIGFMLRLELIGREQDQKMLRGLGRFKLRSSPDQKGALDFLYDLLMRPEGEPELLSMQRALHALCSLLLKPKSPVAGIMAYPTDQWLFVLGYRNGNSYAHPAHLYARCGALQIAFQLILVQMARLHGTRQDCYEPSSMIVELADHERCDDVDLGEGDEDDIDPLQRPYEVEDDHPSYLVGTEPHGHDAPATRFIIDSMPYISATPIDGLVTPFNRMKLLSSAMYAGAKAASSRHAVKHAAVTSMDHVIKVAHPGAEPTTIDLRKWSLAVVTSMSNYRDSIQALLPPNFPIAQFPFSQLTDDYSRAEIFKQPQNAALLDPLRESIRRQIFETFGIFGVSGVNSEACVRWLDAAQSSLKQLAVVFALTSGISPPQHEYRVTYDSTSNETRGLWLLPNQVVLWGNPMARPKDDDLLPAVYMVPSLISPVLMFDITILRPIACQIIRSLSRDDTIYATSIWAHYRRQAHGTYHWTGPEISAPVEDHTLSTLGTAFTPSSIRVLLHSTFYHCFPDLVKQSRDSIVDKAAQHLNATSLAHYGRLATFPPFKHLRFDQPLRFINLSLVWLAMLGVEVPSVACKVKFHRVEDFEGVTYARYRQ
ncbi:hypothetical protein HGRIS_001560 [Hohenbuehelia grisea]|uniref:C2H2-type domain-containing protein n=1 Tax=Hohenbuehelia grisea TaxID=104357 RepID=A0ABR3JPP1_9AGAR